MKIMIDRRIINSVVFLLLVIPFYFSCTHDPVNIELLDTVCFEKQVLPIIQSSCGIPGCHDANTAAEGFAATNYESIMSIVKPGTPRDSKLYKVITDINRDKFMPPSPYKALGKESRTSIMVWIAQGAKNVNCSSDSLPNNPIDTTSYVVDSVTFIQDILPIFLYSCATSGCHDASSHKDGYTLNNYINITSRSGSIVPFKPSNSKLYEVVIDNGDDRMPPQPRTKLTPDQISLLQQWIQEGALNSDYPDKTCDTLNITFSGSVIPVLQSRCLTCHSNSAAASAGRNIKLENYIDVKASADKGSLSGAINHAVGYSQMPKASDKLDNCSIRKIEKWIELGKLNN